MRIFQLLPKNLMDRKIFNISVRVWLPIVIVILLFIGLLSPLFDLSQIHGIDNPKLYFQHLYLDAIAGLGGYWAASFCQHTWHRIGLMLIIDIGVTLLLVTLIG